MQSVQASGTGELTQHLDEADKLAQELSDREKEIKAAMFGNTLASFIASPSMDDGFSLLGKLAFTPIQLPFKQLDMASTDLKRVDIRATLLRPVHRRLQESLRHADILRRNEICMADSSAPPTCSATSSENESPSAVRTSSSCVIRTIPC